MPNWVTNSVKIETKTKKRFKEIMEFVKSEDRDFDFEKIIPMPSNIYNGNLGAEERAMYGENNWYDWSINNWGTKWNSNYSSVDAENRTFTFETAWSAPVKVINRLSREFPDVKIVHEYADEDIGCNCGTIVYKGGEILSKIDGDDDFACRMWGFDDYNSYLGNFS